jgi:hypothetical protein
MPATPPKTSAPETDSEVVTLVQHGKDAEDAQRAAELLLDWCIELERQYLRAGMTSPSLLESLINEAKRVCRNVNKIVELPDVVRAPATEDLVAKVQAAEAEASFFALN